MPNETIPPEIKILTIQNPFLFAKVLEKNPALCRQLLEQAFSLQIGDLDYLGYENIFEDFSDYKDTRTDIYAHEKNTIRFFTIEMQDNRDDSFGKKMRYYRAIMDKDSYQRMNTFADLYIVFICPFDVFKEGHHLYEIKNRCLEDPSIVYDDGCYQIFLCSDSTEDDINSEVRAFLDYVGCGSISTDFVKKLDAAFNKLNPMKFFNRTSKNILQPKSIRETHREICEISIDAHMPNTSSNNSSTNTLFHDYFSDNVRLLSLCNALADTNYTDPQIMEIYTLKGNFFSDRKNEIACRAGKNLFILVENHTYINPNIAFRFIGYLAQILKNLAVNKESQTTENEFSLPSPHCCIFYYGDKSAPIAKKIKLSDSSINSGNDSVELAITAYNINPEVNQPLFVNCRHLYDYGRLIDKIKEGIAGGLDSQSAISNAIKFCLANDVMRNHLEKNQEEVFNTLALQWDSDAALQARFDESFEDGIEFVAMNLIRKGLSFNEICELTGLSLERIKELDKK